MINGWYIWTCSCNWLVWAVVTCRDSCLRPCQYQGADRTQSGTSAASSTTEDPRALPFGHVSISWKMLVLHFFMGKWFLGWKEHSQHSFLTTWFINLHRALWPLLLGFLFCSRLKVSVLESLPCFLFPLYCSDCWPWAQVMGSMDRKKDCEDDSSNHDECMKAFGKAGYLMVFRKVDPTDASIPCGRARLHYLGVREDILVASGKADTFQHEFLGFTVVIPWFF